LFDQQHELFIKGLQP